MKAITYDAGMPSATEKAFFKRVMKDAIREVLEERTDLLHAVVLEALEKCWADARDGLGEQTDSERGTRSART